MNIREATILMTKHRKGLLVVDNDDEIIGIITSWCGWWQKASLLMSQEYLVLWLLILTVCQLIWIYWMPWWSTFLAFASERRWWSSDRIGGCDEFSSSFSWWRRRQKMAWFLQRSYESERRESNFEYFFYFQSWSSSTTKPIRAKYIVGTAVSSDVVSLSLDQRASLPLQQKFPHVPGAGGSIGNNNALEFDLGICTSYGFMQIVRIQYGMKWRRSWNWI